MTFLLLNSQFESNLGSTLEVLDGGGDGEPRIVLNMLGTGYLLDRPELAEDINKSDFAQQAIGRMLTKATEWYLRDELPYTESFEAISLMLATVEAATTQLGMTLDPEASPALWKFNRMAWISAHKLLSVPHHREEAAPLAYRMLRRESFKEATGGLERFLSSACFGARHSWRLYRKDADEHEHTYRRTEMVQFSQGKTELLSMLQIAGQVKTGDIVHLPDVFLQCTDLGWKGIESGELTARLRQQALHGESIARREAVR